MDVINDFKIKNSKNIMHVNKFMTMINLITLRAINNHLKMAEIQQEHASWLLTQRYLERHHQRNKL
jgi:hypothetical protein